MSLDHERLCAELHRLEWARELGDDVIRDIAEAGEFREYSSGQVVVELDSEIKSAVFVVFGRLEVALVDRIGKELERDSFRRGTVVGLFSLLLPERSRLHVEAREQTTVILLGLHSLLQLMAKYREFQLAVLRITANLVKHLLVIDRELPKPAVVS
jgi:NTE family protein